MKIEKVNDNQIRCILTAQDLIDHHVKLSELITSNDQVRSLFNDMMEMAQNEFGFDAEDIPLMIEAIPMSPDSIVLYITKLSGPDSIDDRPEGGAASQGNPVSFIGPRALDAPDEESNLILKNVSIFAFANMDNVIRASKVLKGIYTGSNSLYKDDESGDFFLVIAREPSDETSFSNVCHMLSEYGVQNPSSGPTLAFLEEHCTTILSNHALQTLADL